MRPVLEPSNIYAHAHEEQDVILWYNRALWHSIVILPPFSPLPSPFPPPFPPPSPPSLTNTSNPNSRQNSQHPTDRALCINATSQLRIIRLLLLCCLNFELSLFSWIYGYRYTKRTNYFRERTQIWIWIRDVYRQRETDSEREWG